MSEHGVKAGDHMFRYESKRYAPPLDEFERVCGDGRREIVLHTFNVIKATPKGVWIEAFFSKRFIRLGTRKQFAHPTAVAALESLIARKKVQASIYKARADEANWFKAQAEKMLARLTKGAVAK